MNSKKQYEINNFQSLIYTEKATYLFYPNNKITFTRIKYFTVFLFDLQGKLMVKRRLPSNVNFIIDEINDSRLQTL